MEKRRGVGSWFVDVKVGVVGKDSCAYKKREEERSE